MISSEITSRIIKAFYNVYNELGYGFLERGYENSLIIELAKNGFECKSQVPIHVFYRNQKVGKYFADILVNDQIILEIKAAESIIEAHEFQLINYLKATNIELGYLLNFGKKPSFKRKIYSNN